MRDDLETPTPTPTTDTTSARPTVSEAPRRAGRGMLTTVLWVVVTLVLMAATGYGVYMWQHKKVTDLNIRVSSLNGQVTSLNAKVDKLTKTQASNNSNSNSSISTTSGDTTALKAYTAAQLFEKCQMNDTTAAGSWQDSPAHVQYADLTGRGGETDAFVYATLPGTAGNTQACVFMVKDGTLTQLWRLPENNFLAQSTIKLNNQNQIVYTGYQANTTTQNTIIYTWSSSQGTFVRQP